MSVKEYSERRGLTDVEHLGDGLYAAFDGYHVVLMADRDLEPSQLDPRYGMRVVTNWVGLEPCVFDALVAYRKRLLGKYRGGNSDDQKADVTGNGDD